MKVLITGPNLDDSKQVGGIITVINTILSVITVENKFFSRSPVQEEKSSIVGKLKWFGKIFQFISINSKGHFDVIHVHTAMNKSAIFRDYIWVFLGLFFKAKVLLHVHGGKYLFEKPSSSLIRWCIDRMFTRADTIVVLSVKERQSLIDLYTVSKPIHVLENAIDLKQIPDFKPEANRDIAIVRLIFIGRVTESKGLHDILEGIKMMTPSEREKFEFDMYGEGDLLEEMLSGFKTYLGDRFNYHGIVSGEGKWHAMDRSNIFLLPSRYGEGLPMALLESMALGKIVLTTNDASIGLVVKDGQNGFIVDKYNPKQIKDVMLRIVGLDQIEKDKLSERAKDTVFEKYSAEQYIIKLESIYSESIGQN